MPQIVAVDNANEGMILAEPVVNSMGQTLLPSGVELKSSHIRILKTWNVRTLTIKNEDSEEEVEVSSELLEIAKESLLRRMKWSPRNAAEQEMLNASALYHAKLTLGN